MDMRRFDKRNYRTVSVQDGYGEWFATYESTVLDVMDLRLLERIETIDWNHLTRVADLGCGTGRTGVWLRDRGVSAIDGVDLTPEMVELAREKNVYRHLYVSDVASTPLPSGEYEVAVTSLIDEHLPDLRPLYREAARINAERGFFVLVGYHPYFLINGVPTHFNSASGEPVAIECYVHLFSDHVAAAHAAGWALREMHEGVIDDDWIAQKPKWERFRDHPVSFALVWQRMSAK